jgi:hypothetical protein
LQAKQSSVAPVAGALLLRFLGAAAALLATGSTFCGSVTWVVVGETAMVVEEFWWLLQNVTM